MNRRNFLKGIAASSACCGIGVARFVEPNWIEVTRSQIQLGRTQGVTKRIVHLSDFHYSGSVSLDRIRWAIDLALEAAPQVVCITGDFIDRRMPREPPYLEALERLTRYVPTLGVVGNHDGGRWASQVGGYQDANPVYDLARSAGIRMLENEYLPELKGRDGNPLGVAFVGIGDIWSNNANPEQAFLKKPSTMPTVLLSHNPDSKDLVRNFSWDLMLSGHTHGGQVVVPFANLAPVAPIGDKNFVAGVCPWGTRTIHVNRGIGSAFGLRFNCRPEVSVLDLEI